MPVCLVNVCLLLLFIVCFLPCCSFWANKDVYISSNIEMTRSIWWQDWSAALRQLRSRDGYPTWRIEGGVKRDGRRSAAVQTIKINACRRAIMREIKSPNVAALTRLAPPQTNRHQPDGPPRSPTPSELLGQLSHAGRRVVPRESLATRVIRFHAAHRPEGQIEQWWEVLNILPGAARAARDGSVNLVRQRSTKTPVKTHCCYTMLDCE